MPSHGPNNFANPPSKNRMTAIAPAKKSFVTGRLWPTAAALLWLATVPAAAQTDGYTAVVYGSTIHLSDYTGPGGAVTVPSVVEGLPVSTLEAGTFPTGVTSVLVPASVTEMDGAFDGCTTLTTITVDAQNPNYTSTGGVLFDKQQALLVEYPEAGLRKYDIPNTVTAIGDFAFVGCSSLNSVTIPSSVTSIGLYSFQQCSALISVTIPSSVTSIGEAAFTECTNLSNVFFLGNAPAIAGNAFTYVATNFTVSYYNGATGFTSPFWIDSPGGDGFTSVNLGNPPIDAFGGVSAGSNLNYSSWFGYYTIGTYPLVYQYYLGYEYAFPTNSGVYLYDYPSGHFWYTQSSYFHFVYDFSLNTFLYYYEANTPHRHFYDFGTSAVITL